MAQYKFLTTKSLFLHLQSLTVQEKNKIIEPTEDSVMRMALQRKRNVRLMEMIMLNP